MPTYNAGRDEMRNWEVETFKALLVTASYTPDKDHEFVDDVSANELSGTGYSRATIANPDRSVNTTDDVIVYDCDDVEFGTIDTGETARYMILYMEVNDDSDSPVVAWFDIGSQPTNDAPFVVEVAASGLVTAE